jgi:hypothetical protein
MRSFTRRWMVRQVCIIALGTSALGLAGVAAAADDRHRDRDSKSRHHHEWRSDSRRSHDYDRRDHREYRGSSKHHKHHSARYEYRGHDHRHYRPGWYHHGDRYWAPPSYRGRYCSDHRHYRGVHYHVAARDYYDYYYPRYRYYGPHPRGIDGSLIITIPLF